MVCGAGDRCRLRGAGTRRGAADRWVVGVGEGAGEPAVDGGDGVESVSWDDGGRCSPFVCSSGMNSSRKTFAQLSTAWTSSSATGGGWKRRANSACIVKSVVIVEEIISAMSLGC